MFSVTCWVLVKIARHARQRWYEYWCGQRPEVHSVEGERMGRAVVKWVASVEERVLAWGGRCHW